MYKVVIVDDEYKSIENLCYLIDEYIDEKFEIESFSDPKEALSFLKIHTPDLLFLDVQMPGFSGFDLLEALGKINFKVIFTTAHSDFAIQAIKHSAFDYLLKPIDNELLADCFIRFKSSQNIKHDNFAITELYELIKKKSTEDFDRITISSLDGLHYVQSKNITRVEADGNYSAIYLQDGSKYLSSKNLKSYEALLQPPQFIRVHNSHIVNRKYVRSFLKNEILILKDGEQIPISRRRRKEIKLYLNS